MTAQLWRPTPFTSPAELFLLLATGTLLGGLVPRQDLYPHNAVASERYLPTPQLRNC